MVSRSSKRAWDVPTSSARLNIGLRRPEVVPSAAIDRLERTGPRSIRFVRLITYPEGIKARHDTHPDEPVRTREVDRGLDDHGRIRTGIGDAGGRIFGTK